MSGKLNLVLIFGGKSGEHEVSLMSARSLLNALDREKYEVFQVGITREGRWTYAENALEVFEQNRSGTLNQALILSREVTPLRGFRSFGLFRGDGQGVVQTCGRSTGHPRLAI